MMRMSIFAAFWAVAFLDMAPVMAQVITPTPPPQAGEVSEVAARPHKLRPPTPIKDLRVAAIQAPLPKPRPSAPTSASGTGKLSQSAAEKNPVGVLQQFTLNDLQAALADAQAQTPPDTIAANCYAALIDVVQSPAINPLPSGPGAFQLFQKARDAKSLVDKLRSRDGPLTALNMACAPLVIDAQATLLRLGVIGGAVIGTGGLFPLP